MVENIKIFAADIDGTLTEKGEEIPDINRDALIALHNKGIKVGIASGRPYDKRVLANSLKWNLGFEFDFAICCNGVQLWTKEEPEKVYTTYELPVEKASIVIDTLNKHHFNCINYIKGYELIYALSLDHFLEDSLRRNGSIVEYVDASILRQYPAIKLEVHYDDDKEEEMQEIIQELSPYENITSVCTHANTIEFMDPRANKGVGLKQYCKLQGVDISDTIAFGDMQNDYELIKEAGLGVCLLNGCDECKSVAKRITDYKCDEGGLGHFIFDYIL